jgi:hypothetical protein
MSAKPKKKKPQFWVIDTGIDGNTFGTYQALGPFKSKQEAEEHISTDSSQDWLESCGCLRSGDRESWGDTYIILMAVRAVIPMPPASVKMELQDVEWKGGKP